MDDTVAKMLAQAADQFAELVRVAREMMEKPEQVAEPVGGAGLELVVQDVGDETAKRLGDLVRVLRKDDGTPRMTQGRLSKLLGVSRSAVSHWYNAQYRIPDAVHVKLVGILESLDAAKPEPVAVPVAAAVVDTRADDFRRVLKRRDGTRRMTQAQLARIVGASEVSVHRWQDGRYPVPVEMHQRIVALLEVLG